MFGFWYSLKTSSRTHLSPGMFLQVIQSAPYLCGFLLQELHLSVLEEGEEAGDDVFQEGGVLR